MLTGMPPYYAKDREKLFNSIKSEQVKFPKYLSKEAVSLLEGFFIKDPDKRLGSGEFGVDMIKKHPFFKNIDWDAIFNKKINPPFKPRIKNEADTRYIYKVVIYSINERNTSMAITNKKRFIYRIKIIIIIIIS